MTSLGRTSLAAATAAAVALLTISCSERTIVTPTPSALTPAAAHASVAGFDAFGWLPPLGGSTANASSFDLNGATSVSICAWNGAACTAPPVAQFSTAPTAGQGTLVVNTASGDFEASWNLLSNSYAIRKTYRITVLRGQTEIAAILVDVARGRWVLTRTDGTLATLAAATELPIRFTVALPPVRINEVESSGGVPGDWVELYNAGQATVDLSGYVFKDNDDTHHYAIPAGTSIAPGGYVVLDEASFGFGLGAPDAARLFTPAGTLVDGYSWTAHAATTYGRCPDGTGGFASTTTSTKGAANACGRSVPTTTEAWPGSNTVTIVDDANVFGTNLSGLLYEVGAANGADVLWGVRNGPSTIFRLVFNGSVWSPDPSNGGGAGKTLTYTNGTGAPDSEDLAFTTGSSAGMYVATERDNNNNTVSHPAVLRYDVGGAGTTLVATNEWDLTPDLPVVGANAGLEAITWMPDAYLVAHGFFDPSAGHAYNPADYPNHGDGLFLVGLEGNGVIYVYALNHADNSHHQLASISTAFPAGVMSLRFDGELGQLWATCDDTCGGLSDIFVIDATGHLQLTHIFARPSGMPNINNEGFAFGPQSSCVGGFKPAFWSDDSNTGGHAIRMASLPCVRFP